MFLSHQLPKNRGTIAIAASMQTKGAMLQSGKIMGEELPFASVLRRKERNKIGFGDDVVSALMFDENCRRLPVHPLRNLSERCFIGDYGEWLFHVLHDRLPSSLRIGNE